jgi:hypothetical protein
MVICIFLIMQMVLKQIEIDGFRLYFGSGNLSGKFSLYGVQYS